MKNRHFQKKNKSNQLTIKCEKCLNKKFSTKKALQSHQIRIHNNNNTIAIGDGTDRYYRLIYNRMGEFIIFD
jgi:ribosomal protein S17